MRVIQSIIVHDVIGRPKIVLDQLRDGLNTLGFGARMSEFPHLFQTLFVPAEKELSSADVINVLEFPASLSEEETATKHYLLEFLEKTKETTLKAFLHFITGAPCLPDFGLGKMGVKFEDGPAIFASACMQTLTLPRSFPDKKTLSSSLKAVISTVKGSFNCV